MTNASTMNARKMNARMNATRMDSIVSLTLLSPWPGLPPGLAGFDGLEAVAVLGGAVLSTAIWGYRMRNAGGGVGRDGRAAPSAGVRPSPRACLVSADCCAA